MRTRLAILVLAVTGAVAAAASTGTASGSDSLCTGTYSTAPARSGAPLRFGVDPGLAGSTGGVQLPTKPDNPAEDLAAVRRLHPSGRVLVVRLNRLFFSDGDAGIASFAAQAQRYARAGMEVEIQVRYHPTSAENGDLAAWTAYVRHVVDRLGGIHGVVAMTITNEVNVTFSPNTSDGGYDRSEDALIEGIEAAHSEAVHDHDTRLRFGFTYAYRFSPPGDANFFAYLASHGGARFRRALGFVGLDFYPGSVYPPVMAPGDTYRQELAQAAGVVRDCLAPKAGIGASVPIWITENGVPSGAVGEAAQATALKQLVEAAAAYSRTYGITDYRWFNLRDSDSSSPTGAIGPTFATDGLLRDNYAPKPSFGVYRSLIAQLGARSSPAGRGRRPARHRRSRPRGPRRRGHHRARRVGDPEELTSL